MELDVNFLKTRGAEIVADFRTRGVPLNDGVIRVATDNAMNPEQIARLIEAVNSLAYLSGPHAGADKTEEFPVADYNTILASFAVPTPIEKTAGLKRSPIELLGLRPTMEKQAEEWRPEPKVAEAILRKELQSGIEKLASMELDHMTLAEDLMKKTAALKADPDAINKIAAFAAGDQAKSEELCRMVFGHVKEASAVRPPEALVSVKELYDTLGFAKKACEEKAALGEKLEKIAGMFAEKTGLKKEAFLGAAAGILRGGAAMAKNAPKLGQAAAAGRHQVGKGIKLGGTALVAGPEIAQISSNAAPRTDVWKSLHQ